MAAILQTIFSDVFSWMKSFVFRLKFHWSLSPRVQLTTTRIGLDDGLVPSRQQVITWTNVEPINWCIYVALGGFELREDITIVIEVFS